MMTLVGESIIITLMILVLGEHHYYGWTMMIPVEDTIKVQFEDHDEAMMTIALEIVMVQAVYETMMVRGGGKPCKESNVGSGIIGWHLAHSA